MNWLRAQDLIRRLPGLISWGVRC